MNCKKYWIIVGPVELHQKKSKYPIPNHLDGSCIQIYACTHQCPLILNLVSITEFSTASGTFQIKLFAQVGCVSQRPALRVYTGLVFWENQSKMFEYVFFFHCNYSL